MQKNEHERYEDKDQKKRRKNESGQSDLQKNWQQRMRRRANLADKEKYSTHNPSLQNRCFHLEQGDMKGSETEKQ
jgi:hypothetical protein